MSWRWAHRLVAAAVLVATASGFALVMGWPRATARSLTDLHILAALPAVPLLGVVVWVARRWWLRLRKDRPFLAGLNAWTSRVLWLLALAAVGTGLWVWGAAHPRTLIRARQVHQLASEALVPALVLHITLGGWRWRRRRGVSKPGSNL